jgi:hypothetical protein
MSSDLGFEPDLPAGTVCSLPQRCLRLLARRSSTALCVDSSAKYACSTKQGIMCANGFLFVFPVSSIHDLGSLFAIVTFFAFVVSLRVSETY